MYLILRQRKLKLSADSGDNAKLQRQTPRQFSRNQKDEFEPEDRPNAAMVHTGKKLRSKKGGNEGPMNIIR
jgi:hypothetical protein